jgi:hypothetical protein
MAMQKRRDARLEALIAQAAEEIKRLNPHIGTPQEPYPEEMYADLARDGRELEQLWDEMDRQRGGPLEGEPAAEAVDADRGE